MLFYFSYDKPFTVKADGIRRDEHAIRLSVEEKPLIELCPLDGSYPVYSLLCEEFFARPPEHVRIADLGGAWFLRFSEPPKAEFAVLAQKRFGNALVTLYRENGLKISLETREDFLAESLPLAADGAEIAQEKDTIAVLLRSREHYLAVYRTTPDIARVFFGRADDYELKGDRFSVTVRHKDIAKHVQKTEYALRDGLLCVEAKETTLSESFSARALPERLLPYAFFESVFADGEVDRYLTEEMATNKEKLKPFLGDFVGIFPPPRELEKRGVGLLYRDDPPNKYYAKYFDVTLKNGKIDNVLPTDGLF